MVVGVVVVGWGGMMVGVVGWGGGDGDGGVGAMVGRCRGGVVCHKHHVR